MGFYAKSVLPHLIDLAMRNRETTPFGQNIHAARL
jgi:hypothetical protein